jgi:hypothetical protein
MAPVFNMSLRPAVVTEMSVLRVSRTAERGAVAVGKPSATLVVRTGFAKGSLF